MLVIVGGTVVDHSGIRRADVEVRDGIVCSVEPRIAPARGATVLEAEGCFVAPGLVDLHTHLRQPGGEEAETVETGARAGALGGYTAMLAMPNTAPAVDQASVVREIMHAAIDVPCHVAVAGAISIGRAGEKLAPMAEMAELGVRMFTDDGAGVQDAGLMRRAMAYAKGLGVVLGQHCEVDSLASGGHMHEGVCSSGLGVPGIPAAAEEIMVARDIILCRCTGARVHFLHLSTAGSVALVAAARAEGLPVTAEVAPHHLSLVDEDLSGFDPVFKVNPPLRTAIDVASLRQACAGGVVDAVATDHAPHPPEAKELPLDQASPGMLGLQTAWPVTLAALGPTGAGMEVQDVIGLMSWRPAAVVDLTMAGGVRHGAPIAAGQPANLCVLDTEKRWSLQPTSLASRSRNSPWMHREMIGSVRHTILRGEPVVLESEAQR